MARRAASSFMSTSASVLVYVPGAIPAAKSPLWRLRSPKFFFARAERARTGRVANSPLVSWDLMGSQHFAFESGAVIVVTFCLKSEGTPANDRMEVGQEGP